MFLFFKKNRNKKTIGFIYKVIKKLQIPEFGPGGAWGAMEGNGATGIVQKNQYKTSDFSNCVTKSITKLVVSAILTQKCEFHCDHIVKNRKS